MEFKSIVIKAMFFITMIFSLFSFGDNQSLNSFISQIALSIMIINMLIVVDNINGMVIKESDESRQYFKQYENDYSISDIERKEYIKNEIVNDKINRFFELTVNRFLSSVMVVIIVATITLVVFHINLIESVRGLNNFITIFSCSILIFDINYKEKMSKKVIKWAYNYFENRVSDEELED